MSSPRKTLRICKGICGDMMVWLLVLFVVLTKAVKVPQLVPLPQQYNTKASDDDFYVILNYKSFKFTQARESLSINALVKRYDGLIFFDQSAQNVETCPPQEKCISELRIEVSDLNRTIPYFGMKEGYMLKVDGQVVHLSCDEVFGCYRGMETFSQMVVLDDDTNQYQCENYMTIVDNPRFEWRGLMIDTSRHYLPVEKIKQIINSLSWLKISVLHWHIVDSQSFPLEVKSFPLLNKMGAYSYPDAIYTHDDLTAIRDFAHDRGIRVIVEVDCPGHSGSWGKGYPEIMPSCHEASTNSYVLNPLVKETYTIVRAIAEELSSIFPDSFQHWGGDEVSYDCWKQDEEMRKYKEEHLWLTYAPFVGMFEENLKQIYQSLNKTMVCWEECLLSDTYFEHFKLPPDTVVQVWKTEGSQFSHLHKVIAEKKYRAILSGGWYLNDMKQWDYYYENEPFSKHSYTEEEKERLLGVEACIWGEHCDASNFDQLVFPQLQAIAEKGWSSEEQTRDASAAEMRHEIFRCLLVRRGVNAGPIIPSYCKYADGN